MPPRFLARRSARTGLIPACILSLTAVIASTAEQDLQRPAATTAIRFTVEKSHNRLALRGDVSSTAHEAILRQTAARLYHGASKEIDLQWRRHSPPGWALVTEMALRALSETRSATIVVTEQRVRVRGISTDEAAWQRVLARLEDSMLPGMQLQSEVAFLNKSSSFSAQCQQLFRAALQARSIEFSSSSDELGSNASGLLDELVEIAVDCPAAIITVTGHTDASGNEELNRKLSRARAQAVIDYMRARGIDPRRLIAVGAGSSQPRHAGDSVASRRGNRRIEFSVSLP